jgi:hypothetical protein
MIARMRLRNGLAGAVTLTLVLLVFTGCRSGGGSRGCGGGCCRGQEYDIGPAAARPVSEPALDKRATAPISGAVAGPTGTATTGEPKPYGGQKTCPVTGEELGSMGPAIPVTVNGQTVYVCCRGCAAKVQREPDTYLAKALAERSGS